MAAVGYISDTAENVKASWSLFQHDGVAAFKLSERSPLPPAVSAKDRPGGRTLMSNVHRIGRTNRHPVESDKNSVPRNISNTENWLNWNANLDNPNDSEDDCAADNESDIEQNMGHWGSGMPRAAGCEYRTKCSRFGSANTEVKQTGWKGVGVGQCSRNEEKSWSEENVGQNASMVHQLLYVAWLRVSVRDILWVNGKK